MSSMNEFFLVGCLIIITIWSFSFSSPKINDPNFTPHSNKYTEKSVELVYLRDELQYSAMALEEAKLLLENVKLRKQMSDPTSTTPNSHPPDPPTPPVSIPQKPPTPPIPIPAPIPNSLSHLRSSLPDPDAPRPIVTILLYNKFEGYLDWWRDNDEFIKAAKAKCSTECTFTSDRSTLATADGVAFHVKTHSMNDFPQRSTSNPNQKFIMVSLEQPGYTPLMTNPQYVSKFDMTATYDLESTIPTITIHPHFDAKYYHDAKKLSFSEKDGFGEPNAVAAFVSNCKNAGATARLEQMEELARHIPLHSYGRCLKNKEEPKLSDERNMNKRLVLQRYKFYLSFENNQIKDYVTEKVFDGLLAGTLPIYWGAESIDQVSERSEASFEEDSSDHY